MYIHIYIWIISPLLNWLLNGSGSPVDIWDPWQPLLGVLGPVEGRHLTRRMSKLTLSWGKKRDLRWSKTETKTQVGLEDWKEYELRPIQFVWVFTFRSFEGYVETNAHNNTPQTEMQFGADLKLILWMFPQSRETETGIVHQKLYKFSRKSC